MARTSIQNANASLYLNGSSGYMSTGITPDPTGWCFALWIKPRLKGAITYHYMSCNTAAFTNGFGLMAGTSTTLQSNIYSGVPASIYSAQMNFSPGQWIHIVQTYLPSGVCNTYKNGVLVNSATSTGTMGATTANTIRLGSRSYIVNCADMDASQVVWHNTTTPWTAQQVLDLYNNGTAPAGATAVYPLNEGAGTIAYDTSGNGNNGTITSGTWTRDAPSKTRKGVNGNLVFNGDFEIAPVVNVATTSGGVYVDGTAGGDSSGRQTIFGWFVWNYTTSWEAKFDTSVSHSGNASMKISTTATGSTVGLRASIHASSSFKQNNIPVLPNTSYTYSGWVKTNLVSGSATTGARLQFVTSTGTADVTTTTAVTGLVATQDWTQYTGTFTTAATARFITPVMQIVGNDGTGTLIMDAWFDDITLTPTTPTTRTATTGPYRKTVENLVTNGDFEYAPAFTAAQTSMSRWIDGTAAGAATVNDYGVRVIGAAGVSAQFDSGYLKLVVPANKWIEAYIGRTGYGAIPNYIPILPSTSYTVTMRMKTEYISGDALGARITVYVSDGAFGGVTSYATSYIKTTTDWTTYSVTFTTGATVRYARVACSTSTDTGAANLSMTAYYDDIVLTKTTPDARTTA